MRRIFKFLLTIVFAMILTSCVSTSNNEKEKNEFLAEEQFSKESQIEYVQGKQKKQFVTSIDKERPIIGFEGNNGIVYFECDTGAPYSYIKKSGIKKALGNYSQVEKNILTEYKKFLISNNEEDIESISDEQLKEKLYKD